MIRLLRIDTSTGSVNVYERAARFYGGCVLVGKGQIEDWHPRVQVSLESLEHFRLNCVRPQTGPEAA